MYSPISVSPFTGMTRVLSSTFCLIMFDMSHCGLEITMYSLSDASARLTESHTGKYLAEHLVEVLQKFDISSKVCLILSQLYRMLIGEQVHGVTVDNATNNTTMLTHMKTLIPGFHGIKLRVRCFDHILNSVVKVHSLNHSEHAHSYKPTC